MLGSSCSPILCNVLQLITGHRTLLQLGPSVGHAMLRSIACPGGTTTWKGQGYSSEVLTKFPNRYQAPFLQAWLEIFTPNRHQFSKNTLTFFNSKPLKAPAVCCVRLNTLQHCGRYQTCFFNLLKVQQVAPTLLDRSPSLDNMAGSQNWTKIITQGFFKINTKDYLW